MISALTGNLSKVNDSSIELSAAPFVFALLVPAIDIEPLRARLNQELVFHTIFYLEGSASGGNLDPKLIGFQTEDDRRFFELFTTVKGIGPKTALRALTEPISTIASWIEAKDSRSLKKLNGIGPRSAELIVAELSGKVTRFARFTDADLSRPTSVGLKPANTHFTPDQEDAIRALVNLGERRLEAEALLDRVLRSRVKTSDANELLTEMLRQRAT